MNRRAGFLPLLFCTALLVASTDADASYLERRLESSPAASWMAPARSYLRLAAGNPTLAGASSELGLHGEWDLQAGIGLHLGAELLRASAYREETLLAEFVLGLSGWVARARWEGTRAGIQGLLIESRTRAVFSLCSRSGPLSFGVRQGVALEEAARRIPDPASWAARLEISRLVLALLREDSRWGGEARWSAGLEFRLAPNLRLGLSADEVQEQFQFQFRQGALALRVSIPVASFIDAGPYLALEWSAREAEARP
jgi:hypothetical protein